MFSKKVGARNYQLRLSNLFEEERDYILDDFVLYKFKIFQTTRHLIKYFIFKLGKCAPYVMETVLYFYLDLPQLAVVAFALCCVSPVSLETGLAEEGSKKSSAPCHHAAHTRQGGNYWGLGQKC